MLFDALTSSAVTAGTGFFAEWLAGLNVGGIILMLVGIVLIVVEMIIPGFGIAGLSGITAVVAGLIISSQTFGAAMFSLSIVVVLLCIAALIVFKFAFGKGRANSRLVLKDSINSGATEVSEFDPEDYIGKEGVALSSLHPSGIAMINGKRLDVLSDGEFIQKGDSVVVTGIQGLCISVTKKNGK